MKTENLDLIFPQWQGSGPENTLFYPPSALAALCPGLGFETIEVDEISQLTVENNILGYPQILSQMKRARALVEKRSPSTILTLGGDCGVELIPVSYLNKISKGEMTLVWLDAHSDLNTPATSPSGHFHGMPLAALLGLGEPGICAASFSVLTPGQVILAGIRNPDPDEVRFIRDQKITQVSVEEMEKNPETLLNAVLKKGEHPVYVHIDLDVLDPKAFPHVGCPEPLGLAPNTLKQMLEQINGACPLMGLGLTEFTGSQDYIRSLISVFRPGL